MTNRKLKILSMIREGIPLGEIEKELQLTVSELSTELKEIRSLGYNFNSSYYSDGSIILRTNRTLNFNPNNSPMRINVKGKVFKSLFISDEHIGSIHDNPNYIKVVYNYAKEHDIHVIFNCGDEIDNIYPESNQVLRCNTVQGQITRFCRVFPHDPNIIIVNLYGNHDFKSIIDEGYDVSRVINDRRYDMLSLGYGYGVVLLKDDAIAIMHDLNKGNVQQRQVSITYKGHSHKSKNSDKEERVFYVPSLSDVNMNTYEYIPLVCFLEAEYQFYDKKIERVNQRQLAIINNEIRLANEEALILQRRNREYDNKEVLSLKKKPPTKID